MRAVVATRPGPPDVLEVKELPDPRPGPGQVVIDAALAATTFIDTQLRAGTGPRPLAPSAFPIVLGNGVAGTVDGLGTVVTSTGGTGGYASRALAVVDDLHRIPEALDPAVALALLADGRTAVGLVRAAGISSGEAVAVTAAAGGVGSLLVQLVNAVGARVVALAGGPRKLAIARDLGADVLVDYRVPGWPDRLPQLDVAFDGVGGDVSGALAARLRGGGRFLPHGASSGAWGSVDRTDLQVTPLDRIAATPAENFQLVEDALGMAAAGDLEPTIGQTFPLEEAAAAHAAMEARRTVGKTLLVVKNESSNR